VKDRQKIEKRKGLLVRLFLTLLPLAYKLCPRLLPSLHLYTHHSPYPLEKLHSLVTTVLRPQSARVEMLPKVAAKGDPGAPDGEGGRDGQGGRGCDGDGETRRVGREGREARVALVHLEGGAVIRGGCKGRLGAQALLPPQD